PPTLSFGSGTVKAVLGRRSRSPRPGARSPADSWSPKPGSPETTGRFFFKPESGKGSSAPHEGCRKVRIVNSETKTDEGAGTGSHRSPAPTFFEMSFCI